MFGVWIDEDARKNMEEFARAVRFIVEFRDVITHVMVGNEPVFVIGVKAAFVADMVRVFREQLKAAGVDDVPIGVADIYNMWMGVELQAESEVSENMPKDRDFTSIVAEIDWIGLNSHTYYSGIDPSTRESGISITNNCLAIEEKWKLPCIVTETGFPTEGEPHITTGGVAVPGVENQARFLLDMEMESRRTKRPVYFFEPFNGDFKRRWEPYTEVDYSFGLATCDRRMKDITLPPLGAL
eukprot:Plantae.Rhodophyta-Palmaria_palmata.ctg3687.p1 GENE.Plantae.Rhodophyta-Palmaria_palmata.ctg3687~~Plantae.Rhodophyta-Palmaria_palmata.ctg3687.p1  ORF type:complete len:280 (-),score=56.64 Plantae.Rhodophyta-Palmaria_palmata.ctg3687:243-962(-)